MMASITVTGADELAKKLKKGVNMGHVKKVVRHHGAIMQKNMMMLAAVDTGNMKRSISLEIADGGLTATVGPQTDYAPYVEYGTRYMSAQPFVRPAQREQKLKFINDMKRLMK